MRRIVVTGMGAVSPLAAGVEASWSQLLAGRSGTRRLPDEVVADLPTKIGGVVPSIDEDPEAGFDPRTVMTPKDQRKVDRFILFAVAAADEALSQAAWSPANKSASARRPSSHRVSAVFPRSLSQEGARLRLSEFLAQAWKLANHKARELRWIA
jgi:3-oxoacyl-(acyl-carrier-protein) synthase